MSQIQTAHLFVNDVDSTMGWTLVSWCHEKGADEFSLQCVGIEPAINSLGPAFDQIFAPFHLGLAKRQMLTASSDGDWVRDVDVFTLNVDSIEQLKVILPDGIFTFGYWTEGSEAWFEDLNLYRGTELMLGVVTLEQEGMLYLTQDEMQAVDNLGLTYRAKGRWI